MTDLHPLIAQLVRARQAAGLTQQGLADRLGVTQTAVSYWEAGKRQPGLDDAERWAAALDAPLTLAGGPPADPAPARLTPALLADATANLDAYIQNRAEALAKTAIAREKDRADRRIRDVREKLTANLTRQTDLVDERAKKAEATVQRSREALTAFDGRGVSTPDRTDLNTPTPGEVLNAWRKSLNQPEET